MCKGTVKFNNLNSHNMQYNKISESFCLEKNVLLLGQYCYADFFFFFFAKLQNKQTCTFKTPTCYTVKRTLNIILD